ncbi:MAG: DUF3883 domain-containing protein [Planctomycetes bacterium]|nr:DUF3883 domain-containing protein [Planctomycetota bacterium]
MNNLRSCLIKIEDDALLVANTGTPFDRLGVISLCASHLSGKQDYKPFDQNPEETNLIKAIRDREIETYKRDFNRLKEDYSGERETQLDYGGRAIWELLQNADDAMAPKGTSPSNLIGVKGLGFKSVLEVTVEPEIYSREFNFCFSAKKTQKLIKEEIKEIENVPPLTFRIPHDVSPSSIVKELQKDFVTVIRLPFREGKEGIVQEWLEKFTPECMIFFQYIEILKIILPKQASRIYSCKREKPGELTDCDISIKEEIEGKTFQYRLWADTWSGESGSKRHSVAISLPLKEVKPSSFDKTHPLYVFLPTSEYLPFHALIHGSFDLEQNRKHVRNPQGHNSHKDKFTDLISRIVDSVPASTILRALVPEREPEQDTVASFLWKIIKEKLAGKEFVPCVGGSKTTPGNVRLWKHNLGKVVDSTLEEVKGINLAEQELVLDEKCKKALELFGAKNVENEQYPVILQNCGNSNLDDCRESLKTMHEVVASYTPRYGKEREDFLNNCRKVPCWWTKNGKARSLSKEQKPLVQKNLDEPLPGWLTIDILHEEILGLIQSYEKKEDNESKKCWEEFLKNGLLRGEKEELIDSVLIPHLEQRIDQQEWWKNYGWEALKLYLAWGENHSFDDTKPIFWDTDKQNRMARASHFPTDKGWMPAWRCYAGKSWDGPDSFDEFFKKIPDRGILSPLKDWEESFRNEVRNVIKGKLRYAGVSWEPKVLKFVAKTEQEEIAFKGYPKYPPNCWKGLIPDNYWEKYCNSLSPKEYYGKSEFERDTKLKKQWAIEYFPDALPPKALDRIKFIKPLAEHMWDMRNMTFTCTRGGDYSDRVENSNNSSFHNSFAFWQLSKVEWLPCKLSLIYRDKWISPSDGYLPRKGLEGLLPEINIALEDNQEGRDIETLLVKTLKVRKTLPREDEPQWSNWLNDLPGHVASFPDKEKTLRSVKKLWEKVLTFKDVSRLTNIDKIPCIVWRDENEILEFKRKSEVYWVDEGYLNERSTRNALLKSGYSLFILELQEGERINELFNIERLSDKISVGDYSEGKNEALSTSTKERYLKRYKALKAIQGDIKLPKPDHLLIEVVKNLKLKICKDGQEIASDIPRPFRIKEDKTFLIDEDNRWEGFGLALADGSPQRGISSLFENILKTENWDEVLRRLQEAGVPENSVHELEMSNIPDTSLPTLATEENKPKLPLPEVFIEPSSPNYPEKNSTITRSTRMEGEKFSIQSKEEVEPSKTQRSTQIRKDKGKEAEDWFRNELKKRLEPYEWRIGDRPERDEDNLESDIVLTNDQKGAYHIEVKHAKASAIYWSIREVEKARKNPKRYWMVIIRPTEKSQTGYRSILIEAPLETLKHYERSGT